ncbi:MAG: hypothetical protein AAF788_02490 [Pseudomonadota bacterium]
MWKSCVTAMVAISVAATSTAGASSAPKRQALENLRGTELIEYAAAPYIQFRQDVDYVAGAIPADEGTMRSAHHRLASHDQRALAGAWVAYAGMIAADTPEFVSSIAALRRQMGDKGLNEKLINDPSMVRNLRGSQAAVDAILAFAANDAAKVNALGNAMISKAYSLQDSPWARRKLAQRGMERVDQAIAFAARRDWKTPAVKAKSQRGLKSPNLDHTNIWSVSWAGDKAKLGSNVRAGSIVTKALILGAHYTMDNATNDILAAHGTSARSERCFTSAKLNLDQCVAATRTPYEEAFCLGQHALNDMSSCIGWPAGVSAAGS